MTDSPFCGVAQEERLSGPLDRRPGANPGPAPNLARLNIARAYAHDALKRAERAAKGEPHLMAGIIAEAALALMDAAEMLRASRLG